ncbi:MAG TPA: glutamate synthase subunit alpha, partial [Nocardioidaceae bacterium]|nr:glutamate synthase subunit alpha [Nocardioidaceae bacterium]
MQAFPPPQGLYDGLHEHDACGVAFVATLTGEASHDIVAKAITALHNLEHRGAVGAEPDSGDGAGILLQVPDRFFRAVTADLGFTLPPAHAYAVGTAFLPGDSDQVAKTRQRIEEIAVEEGLTVLGWRDVPVTPDLLGATARGVMPTFVQIFVQGEGGNEMGMALERKAFCLRKRSERETDVYFPSLSSRTIAYKGMLTTEQLDRFFPDLVD